MTIELVDDLLRQRAKASVSPEEEQDAAILYVRDRTSPMTLPGGGRVYQRGQMIKSFVAGIKWEAKRDKEGSET